MRNDKPNNLYIEDAQILPGKFRHFSGVKDAFNGKGDINFCIVIPTENVDELISQGWSIKCLEPRNEGDLPTYFLKCKINFDSNWPPTVELVQQRGKRYVSKTSLDEESIKCLDRADIISVDVDLNPSRWERDDGTVGFTPYVSRMVAVIRENRFDTKFAIEDDPPFDV